MIRDQIFISYSHADSVWWERLQTMLVPLQRQGTLNVWADTRIQSGQLWKEEIQEALARASVAVLLVSPDFLASDFINKHELPLISKQAQEEGLTVLWIPIRPSLYWETEIGHYQAIHSPKMPLSQLSPAKQEAALVEIAQKIEIARKLKEEVKLESLKCLVLLPFDASARSIRDTVDRVLQENMVEPISLESSLSPGALRVNEIFSLLRESDFLIADISWKNPNVFFELGLAHGLGKPFILLLSEESETTGIPSDLMGYQYISYNPSDLSNLAIRLEYFVRSVASRAEQGL